jgi:uncharacterized pyridoxamine 5'-phosphate oxidase family protein
MGNKGMKRILGLLFALGAVYGLASCKSNEAAEMPQDKDGFLSYLAKNIRTVVAATTDDEGKPVTMAIDLMLYDSGGLYFTTFSDKDFYQRLKKDSYISLTGLKGESTLAMFSISIHGKVREISQDKLPEIFEVAPYMKEILSLNDKQETYLRVFQIYEGTGLVYKQKPRETVFFAF